MASKRRRASEAAEPSKKRARFDISSSENDLPPHHEAEASSISDIEDETLIHASPAPELSYSDHVSSHEDDDEESNHDNEVVAPPSDHASSSSSEQDTPEDDLTRRIRAAIEYTTARLAAGLEVEMMTRFYVPSSPPHPLLALLRPLSNEPDRGGTGIAHFIYANAVEEVYELGMPGPVNQDGVDPRWFHGQGRAEVRAGPFAEPADVRAAAGVLRGIETRANNAARANGGRTNKQAAIDDKLTEGLRRQEAGERMHDSSSEGDEVPETRQNSDDHEDDAPATGPSSSDYHSDDDAPAPRSRAVRFVIESSSDSRDEAPAPQPQARPIVESSSDSSDKAPAPRPRARPVVESSSDSSDEVSAPRPQGTHPVIESSSPDSDDESHVVGRRQVAIVDVGSDSDSEGALHDESETEPLNKEKASALSSRNDESKSDSAQGELSEADSTHDEEDPAQSSYDEEPEDELSHKDKAEAGSSHDSEPETDNFLDNASENDDSSTEESGPEPVKDETDGDEYIYDSSDEESQDEIVVPRRSGRVRVQ